MTLKAYVSIFEGLQEHQDSLMYDAEEWLDRPRNRKRALRDLDRHLAKMVGSAKGCSSFRIKFRPLEGMECEEECQNYPGLGRLIERVREADRHAMYLQREYVKHLKILCISAITFLITFELFAHWPNLHGSEWLPFIGLACLIGAMIYQWLHGSRETQIAYLQARCVAEMLRIIVFWKLNELKGSIFDLIPIRHQRRLSHVTQVVREFELEYDYKSDNPIDPDQAARLTVAFWEVDQLRYFHSAYHRNEVHAAVFKMLSRKLFALGISITGSLALFAGRDGAHRFFNTEFYHYLLALAPATIILAGITEFYMERRGFEADAKRYEHAHHMFLRSSVVPVPLLDKCEPIQPAERIESGWLKVGGIVAALAAIASFGVACVLWWRMPVEKLPPELGGSVLIACYVAIFFTLLSLLADVFILRLGAVAAKNHDKATIERWTRSAQRQRTLAVGHFRDHVEQIATEALHELVDWYISSVDREITIPKG